MDAMKASDNLRGFVDAVAKLSTWALFEFASKTIL